MSDTEQKFNLVRWIEQYLEFYRLNLPTEITNKVQQPPTLEGFAAFLRQDGKVEPTGTRDPSLKFLQELPKKDGKVEKPNLREDLKGILQKHDKNKEVFGNSINRKYTIDAILDLLEGHDE